MMPGRALLYNGPLHAHEAPPLPILEKPIEGILFVH